MQIKHSGNSGPNSLSDYERTCNNAIDVVAEALGHAKKVENRIVKAIVLKPSKYRLFVEGLKYITATKGIEWNPVAEITWEGVLILEGSKAMIDTLRFEYLENSINKKYAN